MTLPLEVYCNRNPAKYCLVVQAMKRRVWCLGFRWVQHWVQPGSFCSWVALGSLADSYEIHPWKETNNLYLGRFTIKIKWITGGPYGLNEVLGVKHLTYLNFLENMLCQMGLGRKKDWMCGPWFSLSKGLHTPHRLWCRGGSYICPKGGDGARPGLNPPQMQTVLPRSLLHHAAVWEQAKQQDFVCPFFPKGTPKFHPGMDEEEQK